MILVLGGTSEARQLLQLIVEENWPVTVSTAYDISKRFIPNHPLIQHISGKLDLDSLQMLINERKIKAIVDVTHPYALEISENAQMACKNTGVEYIRLSRSACGRSDYEKERWVESIEEAVDLAQKIGDAIFIAAGSGSTRALSKDIIRSGDKKYFIRVLPDEDSVEKCTKAGFAEDEIITGIGPFSHGHNYRTWERLGIDVVITKDSGVEGGFIEKISAAMELGIEVVVIGRPSTENGSGSTVEDVMAILRKVPKKGLRE